ncbi:MAG TPA: isoprenyl transferase [Nitrospirae bacterium]|nr:isoprenyl transferase [Nitrospirota bacterium]
MSVDELEVKVDKTRLPMHIAIIMDGNGRWAEQRRMPRAEGHRIGVTRVDEIVTSCRKLGVNALTLYSFSLENWSRPSDEVSTLMGILKKYLIKELGRMLKENIRFNTIGNVEDLPGFAREVILDAKQKTKDNTGMTLTLALSYGSRDEIVRAARQLVKDVENKLVRAEEIDEDKFASYLDTKALPPPDLLIRTSGELRISNFLLWQIAYTELYFTDKLWPEFTSADLMEAIISYQSRERRYGKTRAQVSGETG